ncbi:MAG: M48 metallopeptidase family protein [Proteocatella sp.]
MVVYELCHLVHMNHNRSFWRLVGKIQPKYKTAMVILGNTK